MTTEHAHETADEIARTLSTFSPPPVPSQEPIPASRKVISQDAYAEALQKVSGRLRRIGKLLTEATAAELVDMVLAQADVLPPPPVPSAETCRAMAADEDGVWWQCSNTDEDHDDEHEENEGGFRWGDDEPDVISAPERIRFVWALVNRDDQASWRTPQAGSVVHKQDYRGEMSPSMDPLWFTFCKALPLKDRPACGYARREQPDPSWTLCKDCFPAA